MLIFKYIYRYAIIVHFVIYNYFIFMLILIKWLIMLVIAVTVCLTKLSISSSLTKTSPIAFSSCSSWQIQIQLLPPSLTIIWYTIPQSDAIDTTFSTAAIRAAPNGLVGLKTYSRFFRLRSPELRLPSIIPSTYLFTVVICVFRSCEMLRLSKRSGRNISRSTQASNSTASSPFRTFRGLARQALYGVTDVVIGNTVAFFPFQVLKKEKSI